MENNFLNLNNFIAPEWVLKLLEKGKTANNIPHLLLYGPPGTGKTTFAKLLTKEKECLMLNASDERGISTIRNKVKVFAQFNKQKFIVLDECENLTKDSQTCLRRILEDYNSTTFIFITNYFSKIIDPIKSRTLKIRFKSNLSDIVNNLERENGVTGDELNKILIETEGDIRKTKYIMHGLSVVKMNKNVKLESSKIIEYFTGAFIYDKNKTYVENVEENQFNSVPAVNCIKYLVKRNESYENAIILGELERMALNGVPEEIIYERIKNITNISLD